MKTIKFERDKSQFMQTLRRNVNEYFKAKGISTKGNWHMILKSAVMLSLCLVPFILMLTLNMYGWLIFPLAVIMGIGMAGTGMAVMHDAAHGSFSKRGWLNKLFGSTIYLLGTTAFNWKVQHNILHHTFTNIHEIDEDIAGRSFLRFSRHAQLKKVHRYQYIYAFFLYSLMTLQRIVKDFLNLHRYNKQGITKEQNANPQWELGKLIGTKVLYLFIAIGLPLMLTEFSWWQVLLGFIIMHCTGGLIMAMVFQLAHLVEATEQPLPQNGRIDNEWAIHQLETTANFSRGNKFINWFSGGLNYQIEHHLFPNICHIHYCKISHIVERTAKEFGLPYNVNPSLVQAIASHARLMKMLGREK